jgi:hypothetical protein
MAPRKSLNHNRKREAGVLESGGKAWEWTVRKCLAAEMHPPSLKIGYGAASKMRKNGTGTIATARASQTLTG